MIFVLGGFGCFGCPDASNAAIAARHGKSTRQKRLLKFRGIEFPSSKLFQARHQLFALGDRIEQVDLILI
jgi:hypothetical protein